MTDEVRGKSGVRPPLVWVAELFSVLSAAGFLASIWMHHAIFQSWGVSYFQVATPSDVLMGGISTVALALGMLPWLIGGALIASALHRGSGWFKSIRPWLDWPIGLASALLAWGVLTNGIEASLDAARLAVLAYGAGVTWLMLRLQARFAATRFRTASLAALVLGLGLCLGYACGQRITFGFGGDPSFAQAMPGAYDLRARCDDERIVWIGQRALVVRCSGLVAEGADLEFGEAHLVLLNPGALWFGNETRMQSFERGRAARQGNGRPPTTSPSPSPGQPDAGIRSDTASGAPASAPAVQ